MADGVKTTLVMTIRPERADEFCDVFAAMVPATRSYPGCRGVSAYRNLENPQQFILIGDWESKEAYQKYLAWRAEGSTTDNPGDLMAMPPQVEFFVALDG